MAHIREHLRAAGEEILITVGFLFARGLAIAHMAIDLSLAGRTDDTREISHFAFGLWILSAPQAEKILRETRHVL